MREFSFRMAGKEVAGGVLRAGRPFFFSSLVSLAGEKSELFVLKKNKLCFITNALIVEPPALKANL